MWKTEVSKQIEETNMENVIKRARAIKTILSNYDVVVNTINWYENNGMGGFVEHDGLIRSKERYEKEIKNLMEL